MPEGRKTAQKIAGKRPGAVGWPKRRPRAKKIGAGVKKFTHGRGYGSHTFKWGRRRAMKQTALLRWIEAAESARFCLLADEDPARASINSTPNAPPFDLASLRDQLCLGEAARHLSRFTGMRRAD
jgi:hypothetical protein